MRSLLFVIPCLSLVLVTVRADDVKKDPAEIRAKYRKQSADVLKIVEPVKVSEVFSFKDGGTIGIELTDAKDKKHLFCLDGRFLPTKEHPNEKGTRNLFINANHPTRQDAKMVETRGPEESALYGVMLRWADKHPQKDALYNDKIELNQKDHGNLGQIRGFFLRLDSRFTR